VIGSRGAGGSHTALVSNNTVRQFNDRGIVIEVGEGNAALNATVTGNTIDEFGSVINSLHGIHLDMGILAADAGAVCADIGGSTAALRNHVTNAGNEAAGGVDIRMRRGSQVTLQLRGYTGASEDDAAVNAYLLGRNDATTVSATSPGSRRALGDVRPAHAKSRRAAAGSADRAGGANRALPLADPIT
jgi:hypothetical protein